MITIELDANVYEVIMVAIAEAPRDHDDTAVAQVSRRKVERSSH
jgi:hypothetical protein